MLRGEAQWGHRHLELTQSSAKSQADIEAERLAALRSLGLLDTSPSEAFDRVTRLAAQALGAPIVLVSLVDESRQWFKSKFGIDAPQTPRSVSFCAHAVAERRPLIVRDALRDSRFRDNPLVTGEPRIRAYAGIPLYTLSGHAIGTLCAIDRECREFPDQELNILRDFALVIEDIVHALESPTDADGHAAAVQRQNLYRSWFDHAGMGTIHGSISGHLLYTNARLQNMLGYSQEELARMTFADFTHPEDLGASSEIFHQVVAGTLDKCRLEKRYVRKDGSPLWVELTLSVRRSAAGKPEFMIGLVDDISTRKQQQTDLLAAHDALQKEFAALKAKVTENNSAMRRHVKQLLDSQYSKQRADDRLRSVADGIPSMVSYWNRELRCEFANENCRQWFGRSPESLVGQSMADLLGAERFRGIQALTERALDGTPQHFERVIPNEDGSLVYIDVRYVPDVTSTGEVRGFTATGSDVSTARNVQLALEAANAKLANDSAADHLTGLANRRAFDERCEAALAALRKGGERYGLIMLNLNDFKNVNDSYGHSVGDDILRMVGKVLKRQLRSHRDVASRFGGADFAILVFGEYDEDLMAQMAESIRTALRLESVASERGGVQIQINVGIAISDSSDPESRAIQARADGALYSEKKAARERARFGSSSAALR